MKNLKKLSYLLSSLAIVAVITTVTSCSDDDDPTNTNTGDELSGTISADMTLDATKKYVLKGNVFVASGATLTIPAGTIIFGDKDTKGALIIDRGAKIDAQGTADKPVIFTSNAPKGYRNYGDWGGVILLGKAANNQGANTVIEGISAASGDSGKYGGSTEDDNSGTMTYVRIEFAGIALSTDNEINGLTFGSVGSGTTIHHIQVSYSGDDSFEWFGGSVNAKYLVAYRGWDDDFDTDFGYHGKVQFAVAYRDPNIADKSSSNGFESDNDAAGDGNTPKTAPVFSNISWFGPYTFAAFNTSNGALNAGAASNNYGFAAHMRRNSDIQILNSILIGSKLEGVHFDKTGEAGAFKGNYIARSAISAGKAVKKTTTGNNYNDANFANDNAMIEEDQATVDIAAKIAGLGAGTGTTFLNPADLSNPPALLANASALLEASVEAPAGIEATDYIGAFNNTNNWMTGWTSFTPNDVDY